MKEEKVIPIKQVLVSVLGNALTALEYMEELQKNWNFAKKNNQCAALIRKRQCVVVDAFTGYCATLFDGRENVYSLKKEEVFCLKFYEKIKKLDLIKNTLSHRHNRFAHQSRKYGYVFTGYILKHTKVYKRLIKEIRYALLYEEYKGLRGVINNVSLYQ